MTMLFSSVASLLIVILLAGGYPLLPFVIGEEGEGDEDENGEAEEEFHGWG
jgi:hypothetical protein